MAEVPGTLHVCAVPIGNLDDASARLRSVLGTVDAVACEDTRTTGALLARLGIEPRPRLLAHHGHNEQASADGIVELLLGGAQVALVSDAGTPAVSDPGAILVRAAHAAGCPVTVVPGPSSVAAALSVSGAVADGFRFAGFLPRSWSAIERVLGSSADELLVVLESPRRIRATLECIAGLQPDRVVVACRELTKLHEQVERGTAQDLLERLDPNVRGELVLVLEPLSRDHVDLADDAGTAALALARDLQASGLRQREAARIAARHLGGDARRLYDALTRDRDA
jgi:16S rRNA (cytidine1402-2'-O)-methyltransferase